MEDDDAPEFGSIKNNIDFSNKRKYEGDLRGSLQFD